MAYSRKEQETVLVYETETDQWTVYSTVPKHIRKLEKITDITITEYDERNNPAAAKGTLTAKQVSMKKERVMSEEQRQAAAERMRNRQSS
ncbi:hypothetical protein LC087_19350 (plasmid) [Bacillus carboniphilus]|uniref:Uncharacterized protein n=1 Tax=Bacillus carboniphilus TaxID=86663 RepID=A0ABY9K417_9BACI|nr:hypothetical protein [Bacillus carboniphilus]WLR44525.1 hypothetical protein LC087_19350 [Bacillus carboniphilus]